MPLFERLNGKRSVLYNSSKRPIPFLYFLSAGNLSADMHFLHGRSYSTFFFFYDDRSYFCVGYSTSLLPLPNFLTSLFNDHPYFSIGHSELLVATRTFPSATRTFMSSVRTFQSCIRIFCRPFVIFPSVRPSVIAVVFFSSIRSFLMTMFIFSFIFSSVGSQRFISMNICSNGLRCLVCLCRK